MSNIFDTRSESYDHIAERAAACRALEQLGVSADKIDELRSIDLVKGMTAIEWCLIGLRLANEQLEKSHWAWQQAIHKAA